MTSRAEVDATAEAAARECADRLTLLGELYATAGIKTLAAAKLIREGDPAAGVLLGEARQCVETAGKRAGVLQAPPAHFVIETSTSEISC